MQPAGLIRTGPIISVLVAALVSAGCDRGAEVAAPAAGSGSPGEVQLVPEHPRVTDAVSALYEGKGAAVYQWFRNGLVIGGAVGPRLPAGSFAKGDTISVSVTADGRTASASIVAENSLPIVTEVKIDPPEVHAGLNLTIVPRVYDADGDAVRLDVEWRINGEPQQDRGPALSGAFFRRGDSVSIRVVPSDDEGDGEAFEGTPIVIPNAPPKFLSVPPASFSVNGYRYAARAQDPDGDAVAYSLAGGPPGMAVDSASGLVTWAAESIQPGEHTVEIEARDSEGMRATQRYSLTVNPPGEVKQ